MKGKTSMASSQNSKKLSSEFEFETLRNSLIKNMIVCGTNDSYFRKHLCESELTLPKAISAGHAAKETCKHATCPQNT